MRAPHSFRQSRSTIGLLVAVAATLLFDASAAARQESFELGPDDRWEAEGDGKISTAASQVLQARKALALGEPQRARALASAYLDKFAGGEVRPEMLLVRGDALVEMGDEYKALFDYEAITRKYSGSRAFVTALEREYQIAVAYADGRKR
ncbi:MAG: hypothetical protein O3A19_12350, partial [Planctomycetota bacterium]|nr:hypothetical protein [Planctomycetota bacterium]